MEALEEKLLSGSAADKKALERQLERMGEELKKADLTRPAGEAMADAKLDKARDALKELAKKMRSAGQNGAVLPDQIIALVPALGHIADGVGKVAYLADGTVMGCVEMALMIGLGLAIVLAAPNLPQLSARWRYLLVLPCAALALQRVLYGRASEFLYFQF